MKKTKFLIIYLILILSMLSACRETIEVINPLDNTFIDQELPGENRALKLEKETNFTLWSWQIPSPDTAQEYATLIKNSNFDGIDFCVLWSDFEPEENKFDWTYLDSVLDVFVKNDLNLSLSILFWTAGLNWKDSLDFQKTLNGNVYIYDEVRGPSVCLNSDKNIKIIENTIQAFASHCNEKYGEYITRWHVRTSSNGGLEYSPIIDLDYSEEAMESFYEYLSDKYEEVKVFNENYEFDLNNWDKLKDIEYSALTEKCSFDWKLFKQKTIIDFAKLSSDIFKTANNLIPVAFQTGSFYDTMSAVFRGVFDPFIVAKESGADILHVSDPPGFTHNFSVDMLSSSTDKMIAMEIDGAWQGEEDFKNYLKQAAMAGESGVKYINTVNWEKRHIEEYSSLYLSRFKNLFNSAVPRQDADNTEVILINTLDFILKKPPVDLYELYKTAYKVMSGKNNRKVRFITDTQLVQNPSLIDGIKEVHLGLLDEINYMYEEVGILLAKSDVKVIDDKAGQPNFLNQYQKPLDIEIQEILRKKIKEG